MAQGTRFSPHEPRNVPERFIALIPESLHQSRFDDRLPQLTDRSWFHKYRHRESTEIGTYTEFLSRQCTYSHGLFVP